MLKIPFILEKQLNKILKSQLSTIVELKIDNKLKKRFYGKSLLANFLQYIYSTAANLSSNFAASTTPFVDNYRLLNTTGGYMNANYSYIQLDATLGETNGIYFGTGTTPPSPGDYVVETPIGNGTSAGQLNYYQMTAIQGVNVSGNTSSFVLQRIAVNNSGVDITINEVGIYGKLSDPGYVYLFFRDIISGGLLVPDTSTVTITITFSITT